jgi:hypothetical protein
VRIRTQAAADGVGHSVLPCSAPSKMIDAGTIDVRKVQDLTVTWSLLHVRNVAPPPSVVAPVDITAGAARCAPDDGRWPCVTVLHGRGRVESK